MRCALCNEEFEPGQAMLAVGALAVTATVRGYQPNGFVHLAHLVNETPA